MRRKSIRELLGGETYQAKLAREARERRRKGLDTWGVAVVCSGFFLYLWVVFGMAAGAQASKDQVQLFIRMTVFGSAVPFVLSLLLLLTGKFYLATLMACLIVPGAMFLPGLIWN